MASSGKYVSLEAAEQVRFARAFGQLVRNYRERRGLTQSDVARLAFGDEAQKARVSDVERARFVPQANTIKQFADALGIPFQEIQALRTNPGEFVTAPTKDGPGLTDGLLRLLIKQFTEVSRSHSPTDLARYLREKADELSGLRKSIAAISQSGDAVSELMDRAQEAIDRGRLSEAAAHLKSCEQLHEQQNTIVQIEKQVEIRKARAATSVLMGNTREAYTHYVGAASFVEPFDIAAAADVRLQGAIALRSQSRYKGTSGLQLAIDLVQITLKSEDLLRNIALANKNRFWLATFHKEEGHRATHPQSTSHLREAIRISKQILAQPTAASQADELAEAWNIIGLCHWLIGERTPTVSPGSLRSSIYAYNRALAYVAADANAQLWASIRNNLGISHWALAKSDVRSKHNIKKAISILSDALCIRRKEIDAVKWGITKNNIGLALRERARHEADSAACETLREAIECYENARRAISKHDYPVRWAMYTFNLGEAHQSLAQRLTTDASKIERYQVAADNFSDALAVFDPQSLGWSYGKCAKSLRHVKRELAKRKK